MLLDSKMGYKVLVVLCVFGVAVTGSMVQLTNEWRANVGWELTCSWKLFANDSLQSVRLCNNDRQFMIYRPERDGPNRNQIFRIPDTNIDLQVDCLETTDRGVEGRCIMTLQLFHPYTIEDSVYSCEVSGERPKFRTETKVITVQGLVPPTAALVTGQLHEDTGRVTLNCSSMGMPAPKLVWTIEDQQIPQDFSRSSWNATTKLWHAWSLLSHTPGASHAVCTPEISKDGQLYKGESGMYSNAIGLGGVSNLIAFLAITLLLS